MPNDLTYQTPADEDPEVHRYLAVLERPAPGPGLADRVLVRVQQPAPYWLRRLRARREDLIRSGRIWFIVGVFAAGSLIPVLVLAALLQAFGDVALASAALAGSEALAWLAAYLPVLRSAVAARVAAVMPAGVGPGEAVAAVLALTVLCGAGLYWTSRGPGRGGRGV